MKCRAGAGGAPDGGGVVDGVCGDGEDGAGREVVGADGETGAGGDEAREAEGGGAVDAEGFRDDVVEAVRGGKEGGVRVEWWKVRMEGKETKWGLGWLAVARHSKAWQGIARHSK